MRFNDLFINYKIGLKDVKNPIPFNELPLFKKILITIFLIGIIVGAFLLIFIKNICSFIPIIIGIISIIYLAIIENNRDNLFYMLEKQCIPYSEKRMNMLIEILKKYNIDIENLASIDLLIEEAKYAQAESDFFANFKKVFKTLGAIIIPIIPIIGFGINKILEATTSIQMLNIAVLLIVLILLFFSLIFSITPIINDIFYREYNIYNELIYDLRQIKIFYQKKFK